MEGYTTRLEGSGRKHPNVRTLKGGYRRLLEGVVAPRLPGLPGLKTIQPAFIQGFLLFL